MNQKRKRIKILFGGNSVVVKVHRKSVGTKDLLKQSVNKKNNWNWTMEHSEAFNQLKNKITEIPCLAHYSSIRPNTITTDTSTKGLGATLWHEQDNGDLKPIALASRFTSDTEKYPTELDL